MKSNFLKCSAMALLMGSLAQMSMAQSAVLDSIKQKGEIVLGHAERAIPFSYILSGESVPHGFSHDIELAIVEHLKQKRSLPDLKLKYQLLTLANAVEMVENGTVDLHCGTVVNFQERQQHVAFSHAFFLANVRILSRKDSGITSLKQTKDKTMATIKDTWSLTFLQGKKAEYGIKDILIFDREDKVAEALNKGEADAFFMSDSILAGTLSLLENPEDWEIVGKSAGSQRYACLVSKSDPQLKALVDEALVQLYSSGEIYKLYDKWFKEPIPPSNRAIGFEMTEGTKYLYEVPTDKAVGQP